MYGERRVDGYHPLWDSPLFNSWMLKLGFSDLDGDDILEILLSAAGGINGEFTTGTRIEVVSSGRTKDLLVTGDVGRTRRLVLRNGRFQ